MDGRVATKRLKTAGEMEVIFSEKKRGKKKTRFPFLLSLSRKSSHTQTE